MKFKIFPYRILLGCLLAVISVFSLSAQSFEQGELKYTVLSEDERTVEVRGFVDSYTKQPSLEIPATVEYDGITYTVTAIGFFAFGKNSFSFETSLLPPNVFLPSSITEIKEQAFFNANSFDLYCFPSNPPALASSSAFSDMEFSTDPFDTTKHFSVYTIYVPKYSLHSYRTAPQWYKIAYKIKPMDDSMGIEDIIEINGKGPFNIYSLEGILVKQADDIQEIYSLPKGLYICNGKKFVIPN